MFRPTSKTPYICARPNSLMIKYVQMVILRFLFLIFDYLLLICAIFSGIHRIFRLKIQFQNICLRTWLFVRLSCLQKSIPLGYGVKFHNKATSLYIYICKKRSFGVGIKDTLKMGDVIVKWNSETDKIDHVIVFEVMKCLHKIHEIKN